MRRMVLRAPLTWIGQSIDVTAFASGTSGRAQSGRATARVSIAPLMREAAVSSGQVSQLLRGHQADIIDTDDRWLRLRGADGYEGWCHRGYVDLDPTFISVPLASAWRAEHRMSIGCTVRAPSAARSAGSPSWRNIAVM